ncbi:SURF1 family protein [Isoptericola sp. b490]|uniref:SURF1 family protein n=1 Tax=Actinotalea lenta TaxID=3064654 RepID=UPI0027134353|nr:SURF1 family protein [Isoptericola sp. b490]MDO8122351.1 SURF1 family protein [Isoptericola sp. b490]
MGPTVRERLRAAARPRMIAVLAAFLIMAAVFARLGVWQLDRALSRGEARAQAAAERTERAAPVPLGSVLPPQTTFTSDLVGKHVTVTGTFESDQLLVTGRVVHGRTGALVLTPLRVAGTGAVLPVVQGWVSGVEDPAGTAPPPAGEVTVVGWLQVGEAAGRGGFPAGQTDAISPAELVNSWGGPIYTGYLVVDTIDGAPPAGMVALGPPGTTAGGVDWRNLGYALQWWLFGGFALALWWRMLGDEARERRAADAGDGGEPRPESDVRPEPHDDLGRAHQDGDRPERPDGVRPGPRDEAHSA